MRMYDITDTCCSRADSRLDFRPFAGKPERAIMEAPE